MASKRATLTVAPKAGEPQAQAEAPKVVAPTTSGAWATCSVHMGLDMLTLLRMVATRRAAAAGGGRPSVSALVCEILDRHRDELEAEAAGKAGG